MTRVVLLIISYCCEKHIETPSMYYYIGVSRILLLTDEPCSTCSRQNLYVIGQSYSFSECIEIISIPITVLQLNFL